MAVLASCQGSKGEQEPPSHASKISNLKNQKAQLMVKIQNSVTTLTKQLSSENGLAFLNSSSGNWKITKSDIDKFSVAGLAQLKNFLDDIENGCNNGALFRGADIGTVNAISVDYYVLL